MVKTKETARWLWCVLTGGLLLAGAACVPVTLPTTTPAPAADVTGATTVEATEEPMAEATPSPEESGEQSLDLSGVLTGTVTYRQRIALPAGSVIEVQLQDVSRQDVAATVIATQTITTTGENVPIPFELAYDPAQIDPALSYALRVRITVGGELRWINTTAYPVLTRDAPVTGVEVVVDPA